MTKRKVKFADAGSTQEEKLKEPKARRFKDKHSLDSDEEDEAKVKEETTKDVLDDEDIEGQEDETIRNDEGITVTPFNLKDEMEEGHFDGQGNYIPNKNEEDVTDGWLDSVDWSKIQEKKGTTDQEMEEDYQELDVNKVKKEMVELMKPGETVLKALRRLGGNKKPVSSADRWKKKKTKTQEGGETKETAQEKENKAKLLKLTGFADDILQNGDFQIYEKTYEKLTFEIKGNVKPQKSQFDDAAESDDELEAAFKDSDKNEKTESKSEKSSTTDENEVKEDDDNDEVKWMYRLEDNDASELLGPFTNTQMMKWQDGGKFEKTVYCRKVGNEGGSFYSSARIDFELYS